MEATLRRTMTSVTDTLFLPSRTAKDPQKHQILKAGILNFNIYLESFRHVCIYAAESFNSCQNLPVLSGSVPHPTDSAILVFYWIKRMFMFDVTWKRGFLLPKGSLINDSEHCCCNYSTHGCLTLVIQPVQNSWLIWICMWNSLLWFQVSEYLPLNIPEVQWF